MFKNLFLGASVLVLGFGLSGCPVNAIDPGPAAPKAKKQDAKPEVVAKQDLAAGKDHTCAIEDGSVYCWGDNSLGQLGEKPPEAKSTETIKSGDTAKSAETQQQENNPLSVNVKESKTPRKVKFNDFATPQAIVAGDTHTCLLDSNGLVYCWGTINSDVLKDPKHTIAYISPTQVSQLPTIVELTSGRNHVCARSQEGSKAHGLYCWGDNSEGQLTPPGQKDSKGHDLPAVEKFSAIPVKVRIPLLAQKDQQKDEGVGNPTNLTELPSSVSTLVGPSTEPNGVRLVEPSAKTVDGTTASSQTKAPPTAPPSPSLAKPSKPVPPPAPHWVSVVAGKNQTLARSSDDKTYIWGKINEPITIDPGEEDGKHQWLIDKKTQIFGLGENSNCVSLAVGLVCWSPDSDPVFAEYKLSNFHVKSLAMKFGNSCAILDDGSMGCWKDHKDVKSSASQFYPGLGDDLVPVLQKDLHGKAINVAVGEKQLCIRQEDQDIYCRGEGASWARLDFGKDQPNATPQH